MPRTNPWIQLRSSKTQNGLGIVLMTFCSWIHILFVGYKMLKIHEGPFPPPVSVWHQSPGRMLPCRNLQLDQSLSPQVQDLSKCTGICQKSKPPRSSTAERTIELKANRRLNKPCRPVVFAQDFGINDPLFGDAWLSNSLLACWMRAHASLFSKNLLLSVGRLDKTVIKDESEIEQFW